MEETRKIQEKMHKDFFDRCKAAIENGFYMEAILMEYAAIEARLEVMHGLLGLPCNQFIDDSQRKNINISHRVHCADVLRKTSKVFDNTKLSKSFFNNISKWISKRNEYIHGLYKNEIKYSSRIKDAKHFAEQGYDYCRILYNEVNRLKRLKKNHIECFDEKVNCCSSKCVMCDKEKNNGNIKM